MENKDVINDLVTFAITDKTSQNKVVGFAKISDSDAELIRLKTGLEVKGYTHIIDKSAVNHTLKTHGNEQTELLRGQIAVVISDFEKVSLIVTNANITYAGRNKQGRDCILYEAEIADIYFYITEVRTGRKQLAMQTMYKRRPPGK